MKKTITNEMNALIGAFVYVVTAEKSSAWIDDRGWRLIGFTLTGVILAWLSPNGESRWRNVKDGMWFLKEEDAVKKMWDLTIGKIES